MLTIMDHLKGNYASFPRLKISEFLKSFDDSISDGKATRGDQNRVSSSNLFMTRPLDQVYVVFDVSTIKGYEDLLTPQMFWELEKQLHDGEDSGDENYYFVSLISFEAFFQHSKGKLNQIFKEFKKEQVFTELLQEVCKAEVK